MPVAAISVDVSVAADVVGGVVGSSADVAISVAATVAADRPRRHLKWRLCPLRVGSNSAHIGGTQKAASHGRSDWIATLRQIFRALVEREKGGEVLGNLRAKACTKQASYRMLLLLLLLLHSTLLMLLVHATTDATSTTTAALTTTP